MLFDKSKSIDKNSDEDEASESSQETATAVEELQNEVEALRDQLLRRTAEIDNMRRRFHQEREQLIFESNKRLLFELLPTLDDMERTLEHSGTLGGNAEEGDTTLRKGLELVYKNLLKIIANNGVTPMETVGLPFDVHAHDALMEEGRSDLAPGTITKEIQKGYLLGDKVLRHAKVVVAKSA